jgi:hypothetical protein
MSSNDLSAIVVSKNGGKDDLHEMRYSMRKGTKPIIQVLPLVDDDSESRDDDEQPLLSSLPAAHETHDQTLNTTRFSQSRQRKSAPSLHTLHLDLLRTERVHLLEKVSTLEVSVESIQKKNACEKSKFLMRQGHLAVQIQGLKEDRVFLLKKRDRLSGKLLALHLDRVALFDEED